MTKQHKLILIDGHALAYRVFYALPLEAFTTESGEPTNATYGFSRTLLDLILAKNPPEYLAVSFDVGRTFRDDMFEGYKGTREKMPDELRLQIKRIKEVVAVLNIPIMELEGYEADDVLGTLARQAKPHGVPVEIVTGDRDLLQLVDDNTIIELPPGHRQRFPQRFDAAAVQEKYNVTVEQFVDYKALVGDKSDNIPGVRGVGAKTAERLLGEHGSLDGIYENIDSVKGAMQRKLLDDKENAYLSQKLARIVTDAPIQLDLDACRVGDFDVDDALEMFRMLEFRSLTSRLMEASEYVDEAENTTAKETETRVVRNQKDLNALVKALNTAETIAFDLETTGINKMTAEIVGIALSTESGIGYYVPVAHLLGEQQSASGQMGLFAEPPKLAPDQLTLAEVVEVIRPAMTNPKIGKVAHNAKFDYIIFQRHGLTVTPVVYDTMIAEWLTNPASKFLGLKDLSRQRLGIEMTPITDLIGKGKSQVSFASVAIHDAAPYAAADADMTYRLLEELTPEVEKIGLTDLMNDIEMPLIPVLSDMEQAGIGVDVSVFKGLSREFSHRMLELEKGIYDVAGKEFNINSTQQLSDVLFGTLELPSKGLRKTKSGHFSTASDVLEGLRPVDESGIIGRIVEFRELGKLKSTYVDALPNIVNEETGRIHSSFNQTGSVTGRIASNSPNLQNIPIRSEEGRQIRRGFVPKDGHVLLAADYSQVELRVLAHVSKDEALIDAFHNDQDIHATTAAAVYSVPLDEVKFEQRRFAKAVNFGLIYGMGAYRLARDSDLTLAEAENFIKVYFERFPGIRTYLDETKAMARKEAYVETIFGRRRKFPVFLVRGGANQMAINRAEREAINHPIQGSAADIIKIAMIRLHKLLAEKYQARMILQVHDELVLEVPDEELDEVEALVVDTMANAYSLDVPLKVDSGTGRNWLEIKG